MILIHHSIQFFQYFSSLFCLLYHSIIDFCSNNFLLSFIILNQFINDKFNYFPNLILSTSIDRAFSKFFDIPNSGITLFFLRSSSSSINLWSICHNFSSISRISVVVSSITCNCLIFNHNTSYLIFKF